MQQSKNILIAVVALAVIGGGAFLLMNSNKDDEKTSETTTSEVTQSSEKDSDTAMEKEAKDIVSLASATPSLSTLVTAVKAADLVTTLQGTGPFTVLAPTNSAFEALPEGTLSTLLKPESKSDLAGILTYHVIAGKVMSSDLKDGQVVKTVQGGNLTVKITGNQVQFVDAKGGSATVESADIKASNGVVHVISAVLLP